MVSEVVEFEAQARVLVADRKAISAAVYEGHGAAPEAMSFVAELLHHRSLPDPLVVDVGLIPGKKATVRNVNILMRKQ